MRLAVRCRRVFVVVSHHKIGNHGGFPICRVVEDGQCAALGDLQAVKEVFRLAPLGESLLEPMANLIDWAVRRYSDIHAARVHFDGALGGALR